MQRLCPPQACPPLAAALHPLPTVPLQILFSPQNALPDVLCVVQVALEGAISRKSAQASLAAGQLPQVRRRRAAAA